MQELIASGGLINYNWRNEKGELMRNYNISIIKEWWDSPEIVDEAIKVLNAAAKKCDFSLSYKEYLMGGIAIDTTGVPLPKETVEGVLNSDVCLFGAIGGEKWDTLPRELKTRNWIIKI